VWPGDDEAISRRSLPAAKEVCAACGSSGSRGASGSLGLGGEVVLVERDGRREELFVGCGSEGCCCF